VSDLHKELKVHAATNDTTMNDCIVEAVKLYLHKQSKNVNVAPNSAKRLTD